MRRSIATVSLSGTLRQKLEAIAAAGFTGYELFENDFINFKGAASELGRISEDLGLAIELYQPFRDFEGMPPGQFQRSLERAERKFDLMQAMGAQLMLCCSNTSPLTINDPQLAAEQLHELARHAAARGLRVGFEALAWGKATSLYRQAWDIVQRAGHPNLGLILDSFHTLSLQDDPSGIADIPGDKIFFVQMADAPLLSMDVLQWARHHRCFPGQGEFDLANFLEQVLRSGYRGVLSLEIFNDMFRETPNRRTAVDAMRSLLYLESQGKQRLQASALRALQHVELFDPPRVPSLQGLSFIEFAAGEDSAAALGALFTRLGFRRVGRHRSKAVLLYRQGDIHLIVNAQQQSHARERFNAHGTSVCALGIRCSNPAQAVVRATGMLSRRHDSPLGPGEMAVPALVVPGGILLHFIDEALGRDGLYQADFILEEEVEDGVGLLAIDHVALGLVPDQLDTWTLFARAVLGLEAGENQELADPFGLIRSRGFANTERTLRLVFNASMSQRTRTARTVNVRGGGAVHHIALACQDIFASVETLRAQGVHFVPISQNYYDDLPTRIDIDANLLARLRAAGVLFDRSPGGADYLHIYTESFEEESGFFFELVQRSAGYDAYGASNAPARMAAEAQLQG